MSERHCWKCGLPIEKGKGDGITYDSYPPEYAHAECGFVCKAEIERLRVLLREACSSTYIDDSGNECVHITSRTWLESARAAGDVK